LYTLRKKLLVRRTYAARRIGIDAARNKARAKNYVVPRCVVLESNDIISNRGNGRLPLNNYPKCGYVSQKRRHLGLASVAVKIFEERGNGKRAV
jgi:hypothetical protein